MARRYNMKKFVLMAAIALVILLNLVYSLNYPVIIDEAGFAGIGNGIAHGLYLYKDFIDNKSPGVHYFSAMAITLFGNSIYTLRLFLLLVNILTAVVVYKITKAVWNRDAGIAAFVIFMLGIALYANGTLYTEVPLILLLGLGTLSFVGFTENNKKRYLFISGFFFGIGFVFRMTALASMMAIFAFYALEICRKENRLSQLRKTASHGSYIFAGFLFPVAATAVFFWQMGLLNELIFFSLVQNMTSYSYNSAIESLKLYNSNLMAYLILWIFSISYSAVVVVDCLRKKTADKKLLLVLFMLFSAVHLSIAGFAHYFIQPLLYAAMLGGAAVHVLYKKVELSYHFVKIFALASVIGLSLSSVSLVTFTLYRFGNERILEKQVEAGRYLNSVTGENERLFIIGNSLEYYFLSDRQPSYRNFGYFPMNKGFYNSSDAIESLKRHGVRYVVLSRINVFESLDRGEDGKKISDDIFAPIYDYVYENYEIDRNLTAPEITIYRLKNGAVNGSGLA